MSIKLFSSIHEFHHFTALQRRIPLPVLLPRRYFIAVSGDRAVLACPIQPGALIQYYSVEWYIENSLLARAAGREYISIAASGHGGFNISEFFIVEDSRYNTGIDRATFSLIIDPVNINDTSTYYKCRVFAIRPTNSTGRGRIQRIQLHFTQSNRLISLDLSLQVISKYYAQH